MDPDLAAQVCAQLNAIAGAGWECCEPEDRPPRDKKPPKAQEQAAAA